MKLKSHQKEADFSYTFGAYPTLELFKYRPDSIKYVYFSSKGNRNKGLDKIKEICKKNLVECRQDDRLVEKLSQSENAYVAAVFDRYKTEINKNNNHLVLVGPRDSGNLGTIIRSMVAFGFKDLAIIRPAVDIYHPKTIRASMGEIFQVNFEYFDCFEDYRLKFGRNFYPMMTKGKHSFENTKLIPPYSIIFGSESAGLDEEFLKIGESLRIFQSNQVDSLNLATAVGIVLHKTGSEG